MKQLSVRKSEKGIEGIEFACVNISVPGTTLVEFEPESAFKSALSSLSLSRAFCAY